MTTTITTNATTNQDDLLELKKQEFCNVLDSTSKSFIIIGKYLNEFKDEYGEGILSNMTNIANQKGYSYQNLSKYMQVSREFVGEYEECLAAKLGIKKAYALLSIKDKNERLELINREIIKTENGQEIILSYSKIEELLNKKKLVNEDTILAAEIKILQRLTRNVQREMKEVDVITSKCKDEDDVNYTRRIKLKNNIESLKKLIDECNEALNDYLLNKKR